MGHFRVILVTSLDVATLLYHVVGATMHDARTLRCSWCLPHCHTLAQLQACGLPPCFAAALAWQRTLWLPRTCCSSDSGRQHLLAAHASSCDASCPCYGSAAPFTTAITAKTHTCRSLLACLQCSDRGCQPSYDQERHDASCIIHDVGLGTLMVSRQAEGISARSA